MAAPNILVVDDRTENLVALVELLKRHDATVLAVRSGEEALETLLNRHIDLAILDVRMPRMDGYELAELMRGAERTRYIPIIFVTASDADAGQAFRGYEVGAVDFLVKPIEPRVLDNKVRTFMRLAQQRSELADAVRERDQLLSLVSHDLRSPLGAIGLQVSALQQQLQHGHDIRKDQLERALSRIRDYAARADKLLVELLDAARARMGAPLLLARTTTDLVAIATRVVAEQGRLSASHRIEVLHDASAIVGDWDAPRIERVVENLVSNAVKYSPVGAPITLSLDTVEQDKKTYARLRVKDNGIGVPKADLERIFQWFERGNNVGATTPGIGIGLAGSRAIADQHGGSITVASDQGVGSTFTLMLPLKS